MMFSKLEKSVKTTRFAVSGTAMARRLRVPHFTESAVSVHSGSFATLTETSVLATSPITAPHIVTESGTAVCSRIWI